MSSFNGFGLEGVCICVFACVCAHSWTHTYLCLSEEQGVI